MHNIKLDKNNKLNKKLWPGIYLDSKFAYKYIEEEGAEYCFDGERNEIIPPWEDAITGTEETKESELNKLICDLVDHESKNQTRDFGAIRHLTTNCLSTASLIITPFTIMELIKIYGVSNFEDFCTYTIGFDKTSKLGKQGIAQALSKLLNKQNSEDNEIVDELFESCSLHPSDLRAYGLEGTCYIDDLPLHTTEYDVGTFLWKLSLLQLDTEEILDVHAAAQLGCKYIATLSPKIKLNKQLIEESTDMTVITNANQLLKVLNTYKKQA